MDNSTREFLSLEKKLLAEMRTLNFNFLRLREVVTALEGLPERIDTIRDQEAACWERYEREQNSWKARLEQRIYECEKQQRRSKYDLHYWTQVLLVIGTWAAFVAAFVYVGVTTLQWNVGRDSLAEIQRQTKLVRQQLVGSQAAVLSIGPPWLQDGNRFPQKLIITINNFGVMNALHVNFMATVQRESLPQRKQIGAPLNIAVSDGVVTKAGILPFLILPWRFPEQVAEKDWPGRITVVVSGWYAYDNGFGDVSPDRKFCYFWLPDWNIQGRQQGWGGGGWSAGAEECDIHTAIQTYFDLKKQAIR